MKRILSILLIAALLAGSIPALAANNSGYEGGISKNEFDPKKEKPYAEVTFITGEPVLVKGKMTVDAKGTTYTFKNLESDDGKVKIASKQIKLNAKENTDSPLQTIVTNSIASYKEVIEVTGGDGAKTTYNLTNYQFNGSMVYDNLPVITFYQGMWSRCKKVYTIGGNPKDTLTVDINGNLFGYDSFWSSTETQKINHTLKYEQKSGDTPTTWEAYGDIELSFNKNKGMTYFDNQAHYSSFAGAYGLFMEETSSIRYSINGKPYESFKLENNPPQEMLYIPKYEDIRGHWAEESIKKLASMKIIENDSKYFGGDLPETRADFARHLAIALHLNLDNTDEIRRSYIKGETLTPLYVDVPETDPDYKYIKAMSDQNVMKGKTDDRFFPKEQITRAEAITIIIRALGLERLAPTHDFKTSFKDDAQIPKWAKKSIYVADYIGIAKGYKGYITPNETITKAEAAVIIDNLVTYLQTKLKKDYREGILN